MMATNSISIVDAAKKGIDRLREPIWASPEDHLKIDIIDGKPGPWFYLYSPLSQKINGRDPVPISIIGLDIHLKNWLPYDGLLPETAEYKAKVAIPWAGSPGGKGL